MKRARVTDEQTIGILKEQESDMRTADVKRDAVAHVCKQHGVSQRRACEVLSVDRSSVRCHSFRPDDADICETMKLVASERRRFGYPLAGR